MTESASPTRSNVRRPPRPRAQNRPRSGRWLLTPALVLVLVLGACREPDRPSGPGPRTDLVLSSDPEGASIFLNGTETGEVTPTTLRDVPVGVTDLALRLDSAGFTYGFNARFRTEEDEVLEIRLPMLVGCASAPCLLEYREPATVRFATSALGTLLFQDGQGQGLFWPGATTNSYASVAMPMIAGIMAGDTVALGPYSLEHLAGRPAPTLRDGPAFHLHQSTWLVPPQGSRQLPTIRGIEVEEQVVVRSDLPDALAIRLTFRNITDRSIYSNLDPAVTGGVALQNAWIGLALDADVGASGDDLVSYDPGIDLAFMYDSDFHESGFAGEWSTAPGLIGLRVLEAPAGASVVLNGWPSNLDWVSGLPGGQPERSGLRILSGTQASLPSHPHPKVGHAPSAPADYRISAAVGPLTLAAGDSLSVTLAIVLAAPVPGSFTSGTVLEPGDPSDPSRPIMEVAETLRARAEAAGALVDGF